MGQHFLLSARAKTLSAKHVARMSEEEAYDAFVSIRYAANEGEPFCVWCGCEAVYKLNSQAPLEGPSRRRRTFKCQRCGRHSSVTSQTIFASRKLAFRDILYAIVVFANGAKGVSALRLSREMGVQYKTAFVLEHKLREALTALQDDILISGKVEIDGAYFGGYVKPANRRAERRDRRRKIYQSGKRKCVTAVRQRGGPTITFIGEHESGALPEVASRVELGSEIYADEAKGWDPLHAIFKVQRIDHSKEYSRPGGVSTNQVECLFSRLRRAETGTHHHIARRYLSSYAGEIAWRDDNRRLSNGEQVLEIMRASLRHPVSRMWSGYWQRRRTA